MTINEVLDTLEIIKPHGFPRKLLVSELQRLDGRVAAELMPSGTAMSVYDAENGDALLMVPEPYDLMYLHYCCARVDFWNGEIERYNSDVTMFSEVWNAYAAWVMRSGKGTSGTGGKRVLM